MRAAEGQVTRYLASRGFTLIELLFAMAMIAILAAIALPSFAEAFHRARRSEGVMALAQLQLAQERWRADHAAYASTLADLGLPANTASGSYRVAIVSADATGYVATATAASLQAADAACKVLRLTQRGDDTQHASLDAAGHEADGRAERCWR